MAGSPNYTLILLTRSQTGRLADLLLALAAQSTAPTPEDLEVIVIDNSRARSAEAVVDYWSTRFPCPLRYFAESRLNLAHSRNLGLARARGNAIILLDDRQMIPPDFWSRLDTSWRALPTWVGAGAFQKIAVFENDFPSYLRRVSTYRYPSYRDMPQLPGERVSGSGVIFRRACFDGLARPFNPELGMLGADDSAFFAEAEMRGFPTVGLDVCVFEKRGRESGGFRTLLRSHFRLGRCHALRLRRGLPRVRVAVAASGAAALGLIAITFVLAPFRNVGRTIDGVAQAAWRAGEVWGYLAV